MSRAYQVKVSDSMSELVHFEDKIQTTLCMLPILPAERMAELLERELAKRGWEISEGVAQLTISEGENSVVVVVELATSIVTLQSQVDQEVEEEMENVVHLDTDYGKKEVGERTEKAKEEMAVQLQQKMDEKKAILQKKVTAALESQLKEVQGLLDSVGGAVSCEALKEKAASLGDITELHEDPITGAITIKVAT